MSVGIFTDLETTETSKVFKYTVDDYAALLLLIGMEEGDIAYVYNTTSQFNIFLSTKKKGGWQYKSGAWEYGNSDLQTQIAENITEIQENETGISTLESRVIGSVSGETTGGGNLTADRVIGLADTTVLPGSYTNANVTVDSKGRVTVISSGTVGSSPDQLTHVLEENNLSTGDVIGYRGRDVGFTTPFDCKVYAVGVNMRNKQFNSSSSNIFIRYYAGNAAIGEGTGVNVETLTIPSGSFASTYNRSFLIPLGSSVTIPANSNIFAVLPSSEPNLSANVISITILTKKV